VSRPICLWTNEPVGCGPSWAEDACWSVGNAVRDTKQGDDAVIGTDESVVGTLLVAKSVSVELTMPERCMRLIFQRFDLVSRLAISFMFKVRGHQCSYLVESEWTGNK
jgi:hypothetical protein